MYLASRTSRKFASDNLNLENLRAPTSGHGGDGVAAVGAMAGAGGRAGVWGPGLALRALVLAALAAPALPGALEGALSAAGMRDAGPRA